jgi:N-acetylglutamate synthase-like GNAT family acetyltransferase
MDIVKASFKDLEYVLPLILEYYENDRSDVEVNDEYVVQQTATMLQSDNCAIFAAVKDLEVVGVAGLSVSFNMGQTLAQEVFWKVSEEYTSSKAGAKLLKALEDEAATMEADAITVVALPGAHERRVGNSYKSRGYSPVCSTYKKKLG